MTAYATPLHGMRHYSGSSKVVVGSGAGLPNSYIGVFSLSHDGLSLYWILVVPTVTKNLLSVSQFLVDNNCYFIFNASDFFVREDQTTGRTLLKGTCRMTFIHFQ